jgi:hypothetical protein
VRSDQRRAAERRRSSGTKMVEAKGPDRKEFRTSVIKLACIPAPHVDRLFSRTGVGRDRGNGIDQVCNRRARFLVRAKKLDNEDRSIESRGSFDVRFAYEPFDFFWSGSGAMNNQQYTNVKY